MVKAFTFTNYLDKSVKVTLKEAEPDHGLLIRSIDGLGPVHAQLNSTELVTIDGSKFNSARRLKRNIVINFIFVGADIEAVRYRTYEYFPEKKYITVLAETDTRSAIAYGYVEYNDPTIFSKAEGCQVSIICDDPNFYAMDGNQLQKTDFFSITPLFEFPFSNESLTEKLIEFGSIELYKEKVITYYGDVEVGILIRVHFLGPAGDMTIYNLDTRETMKLKLSAIQTLTGMDISAGDDIIISTVRNEPYVHLIRGGVMINVLNILDKHSTWFELRYGDNLFAFVADSGENNIQLMIENRTVYRGV